MKKYLLIYNIIHIHDGENKGFSVNKTIEAKTFKQAYKVSFIIADEIRKKYTKETMCEDFIYVALFDIINIKHKTEK